MSEKQIMSEPIMQEEKSEQMLSNGFLWSNDAKYASQCVDNSKVDNSNVDNSNVLCILCSDGFCVLLDTGSITNCPPVLGRLLGLVEGFALPEVDNCGRLIFAFNLQIPRRRFLECINFLRTGYVRDVFELSETFNVLGGCDELDIYFKNKLINDAKIEQHNNQLLEFKYKNPLCPEMNIFSLYKFEIHGDTWVHDDTWEITSVVKETPHMYWWRSPNTNTNSVQI